MKPVETGFHLQFMLTTCTYIDVQQYEMVKE